MNQEHVRELLLQALETERGGIDGTVETRVTRIVESLLGVITDGD